MRWSDVIIVLNLLIFVNCGNNINEDVWEEDLSNKFHIDASTDGIQNVQLKCGADSMQIELLTKEEFTGVMYTRGSFYKQKEPCFIKPTRGSRAVKMNFNFNQCQTLKEGEVFSNVIVIQHDPELVTTGDSAFQLECDFRRPRSLTVGADFQARDPRPVSSSRITLTSPDPSAIAVHKRSKRDTAQSETHEVTFIPHDDTVPYSGDDVQSDESEANKEHLIRQIIHQSRNL